MSLPYSVSYRLQEPTNGRAFSVSGQGLLYQDAEDEANTKVAMCCGTIIEHRKCGPVDQAIAAGTLGTPATGASYTNGVIIMGKGLKRSNVRFDNITNAVTAPGTALIDLTNALVVAFKNAYTDRAGAKGYFPAAGFVIF